MKLSEFAIRVCRSHHASRYSGPVWVSDLAIIAAVLTALTVLDMPMLALSINFYAVLSMVFGAAYGLFCLKPIRMRDSGAMQLRDIAWVLVCPFRMFVINLGLCLMRGLYAQGEVHLVGATAFGLFGLTVASQIIARHALIRAYEREMFK